MTDEEFEKYMNLCFQEIGTRQNELLEQYGLQNYKDFYYSQTTGTLQFKTEGKVGIEFEVIQIGSWSSISGSWMWAWANESVTDQKSVKIKELAEITGYDIFSLEAFEAKESTAHQLTAISAYYLDAIGYYIAPFGELKSFMALIKVI